ncbi:MAG: hypothetical protein ACT4P6_20880 [Gemmatimonadaceae bacterium]
MKLPNSTPPHCQRTTALVGTTPNTALAVVSRIRLGKITFHVRIQVSLGRLLWRRAERSTGLSVAPFMGLGNQTRLHLNGHSVDTDARIGRLAVRRGVPNDVNWSQVRHDGGDPG